LTGWRATATLTNMPNQHPSGLAPALIEELREQAAKAAEHSYSPYSHFRVGAALLISRSGVEAEGHAEPIIVAGCNVENASYRLTTCAEQAAIATAVGLYGPGIRLRAVAVANLNGAPSMPCGACRQTILEFSGQDLDMPNTWIFYPGEQGAHAEATLTDLLPAAFRLTQNAR
jgi:cytidine deaminase